jgi:hypothetical protein
MKKKWKRPLMAMILAAGIAMVLPFSEMTAKAVDLTQECALTVAPGGEEMIEDLAKANVVIDLYKVADAVPDEVYDTYSYSLTSSYGSASLSTDLSDLSSMDNEAWHQLALEAAKWTLNSGQSIGKAVDGASVENTISELDSGLYLLIARGSDIANYVTTVKNEDGEDSLVTIAHSKEYVYSFSPELISIPSKAADEDGVISTANTGDWQYDLSITLKPEQSVRFGNLEITKTLQSYESGEPATFVFSIEGKIDGETVYSNVAALNFTSAGQQTIQIEDQIPVGAEVTVTEVYSGSKYTVTSDTAQTVTIVAPDDGTASVQFANTYSGANKGGHGIINQFNKTDGTWNWNPIIAQQ